MVDSSTTTKCLDLILCTSKAMINPLPYEFIGQPYKMGGNSLNMRKNLHTLYTYPKMHISSWDQNLDISTYPHLSPRHSKKFLGFDKRLHIVFLIKSKSLMGYNIERMKNTSKPLKTSGYPSQYWINNFPIFNRNRVFPLSMEKLVRFRIVNMYYNCSLLIFCTLYFILLNDLVQTATHLLCFIGDLAQFDQCPSIF